MVFNSIKFILFFLPIFLIIYYIFPNKAKNAVLFLSSIVFYLLGANRPGVKWSLIFIIISILLNYILGKIIFIKRKNNIKIANAVLFIGIIFNFAALCYFKYTNFFIETINSIFRSEIARVEIAVPIGISFFTFQAVSYLCDVKRGEIKHIDNIAVFSTYLLMFPKMLAGPITKYGELQNDLNSRKITAENLESGLKIFIFGLGYKVILADTIATLWASTSRYGYDSLSTPMAWLGAVAFSFDIFFDFQGYSLMAQGLGTMMGISIPQNFNSPYISSSMGEFWRRWHMTLGRWFKEYLYFPLGGSKCSNAKILRNTFIVWAFTGLWHGASWNFVLWGLSFFVFLTLERYVYGKALAKTHILKHVYVIVFIPVTWILFAITNIKDIGIYFSRMFPFAGTPDYISTRDFATTIKNYWVILIACVFFSLPFAEKFLRKHQKNIIVEIILIVIFGYSLYRLHISTSNPFMYLQF